MKHFFSIVINHDYDKVDARTRGVSNDAIIIPAKTSALFVSNNQLYFRNLEGSIECFIEDDEAFESETDILFFWVVCKNVEFFSYTDYPNQLNFSKPQYNWSNSEESTSLQQKGFQDLGQGMPPNNAIGCIDISLDNLASDEPLIFTVDFKARKTFWQYHIILNETQKDWIYKIEDYNEEWIFDEVFKNKEKIIFQLREAIPYLKKATNRLKLVWEPKEPSSIEKEQSMILPIANYAYKMVIEDKQELTPVYIHI